MKKTRYQIRVDKVYANLTDKQLVDQIIKLCKEDYQHCHGKVTRAIEELKSRHNC